MTGIRLNRYLATAGVGSRRAVEALIAEGRVQLNGAVATSPGQRVEAGDEVLLNGRAVAPERLVTVLLHKPDGVLSSSSDGRGRRTVVDLVGLPERLYPVGRLDADSTGALLLTNDGDLAHLLMHPRHGVRKTYLATVGGEVTDAEVRRLRAGIDIGDERPTAPAEVRVVERRRGRTVLEITIGEGRNRQVRRMLETVRRPVLQLHRPRYASLDLTGLAPGDWRALSGAELRGLRDAAR